MRGLAAALALGAAVTTACGGSPATAPPRAAVSQTALDFGLQDCGGQAAPEQAVTLTNTGGSPLTWHATLDDAEAFVIAGDTSGAIPPSGSALLVVSAKAVPTSALAGVVVHGTLIVTTTDAARPSIAIPIQMTTHGAMLSVLQHGLDFGQIPVGAKAPDQTLTVSNSGNAGVEVALALPKGPDLSVTWDGAPSPGMVAPGGTLSGAAVRFQPSAAQKESDATSLIVTGPVCGVLPQAIPLQAEGVEGVAGISPGTLDFGLVNCGGVAKQQQVVVMNTGAIPMTFTASLALGPDSPYLLNPIGGKVLAQSQTTLFLTPRPVPKTSAVTPDLYGDDLVITTDAHGDQPHHVALKETAQGAILSVTGNLAFGRHRVDTSATTSVTLVDSGNLPATVTATIAAPFSVTGSPQLTIAAGGSASTTLGYTPDPAQLGGTESVPLVLSTPGVLCQPLPSPPVTGTSYDRATSVAAGDGYHACAIATSGRTYCWGNDQSGQLGDGKSQKMRNYPAPVKNLSNATMLALGNAHSCALVSGGAVACWGDNTFGELGDGTTNTSSYPVNVSGITDAVSIGAGQINSYAVLSGGTVMGWGANEVGSLGDGTDQRRYLPVAAVGVTDAIAVLGGWGDACAVRSTGGAYCWGDGYDGTLGNGTEGYVYSYVPVSVSNLTDAASVGGSISENSPFACMLRTGGGVACWGDNTNGELGDGTFVQSDVPVAVSGLADAIAIAQGSYRTCAVRSGGGVVCWGNNTPLPVAVPGVSSAVGVALGDGFGCVLDQDGTVLCWGDDTVGELGDRGSAYQTAPVPVSGFD